MDKSEMREYQKQWHLKHKDDPDYRLRRNLARIEYTERHREEVRARCRLYYEKNKKKWSQYGRTKKQVSAHSRARNEIRWGRWKRETRCSKCGKEKFTVMHHEDYSKPLDVVFLCRSCHGKLHLSNRL
jgi:hypothetical protein